MDMKLTETQFESLVLRGLFAACLIVSGLILTAMVTVTVKPASVQLVSGSAIHALFAAAPSSCTLLDLSNIVCLRAAG
jgi:hypothetical protein